MKTITDYSRKIDFEELLLEYKFTEAVRSSLENEIEFEREDSNFAPEPSVACRIKAECGMEFALIYLQVTQRLFVYAEAGADRSRAKEIFAREVPILSTYLLRSF